MPKAVIRMFVACRARSKKNTMTRVVKTESGVVVLDYDQKTDGRGAYVCRNEACVKKVIKTKMLDRALSTKVGDDVYEALPVD